VRRFLRSRLGIRGSYDAAESNRLLADWNSYVMSAVQEMRYELPILRARSRALVRNNPHARKFINALTRNVVGPNGIRLQATNLTGAKRDRALNGRIEQAWQGWGRRGICTIDRRLTWQQVERLVLIHVAMDGEALVRRIRYANNAYGFALQLIDPDLLDENYNVARTPAGTMIRMGIEMDRETQAPVAYHLWTRHIDDGETGIVRERVRVSADEMDHLFLPFRIGQIRGIPWMAPAMRNVQILGGYVEAEVVAARTASAKMGFIEQSTADGAIGPDPDSAGDEDQEAPFIEAAAGVIERLGPGEKFSAWNPDHPTAQVHAFVNAMLHFIAAGLDVAAVTLTGDLSQANYSSLREGKVTERDTWQALQAWYSESLHEPVFLDWLPLARTAGQLSLSGPITKYIAHKWQPRGWAWVDPLKDVQASERELALRLTTRTRLAAERGDDLEEILTEWKAEQDMAKELGVALPDPQPTPIAQGTYDGTDSTPTATGSEGAADAASASGGRARLVALRQAR
jgi:lambda family phage portal protein